MVRCKGRSSWKSGLGNGAILIGLIGLSGLRAACQSYLFGRADFNVPAAYAPVAADFNGDGKPDLAVTQTFSGTGLVSVLLAKPDGTFSEWTDMGFDNAFQVGNGPFSLTVGDFNGDGKMDIAAANFLDNNVSLLIGNGDETFKPHLTLATGQGPASIAAGDFNADDKLDLIVANRNDDSVSLLLGNGDGTFQGHTDLSAASFPAAVVTGDFNGDGKLDIAVGTFSAVSIMLGNGNGTFADHADVAVTSGQSIAVADYNLDGATDLAVLGGGGSGVEMLLGQGDGTFTSGMSFPVGNPPNLAITTADLNKDGKPDLVVSNVGSISNIPGNSISVLIGKGDGTFQSHVDYATAFGPVGVTTLDVNGDGALDVVVACAGSNNVGPFAGRGVSVLLGKGNGTFQTFSNISGVTNPASPVVADLNNDGSPDLVVIGAGGTTPRMVSVLLSNNNGTFKTPTTFAAGSGPVSMLVGDFNNDAKLDLAVFNQPQVGTNGISILFGTGSGTFAAPISTSLGAGQGRMAAGDFNGDAKLDLVISDPGFSQVLVLLGNGNGTFKSPTMFATGFNPSAVVTGDFNNDGKADLAVAVAASSNTTTTHAVSILLGNGNGTFASHANFGPTILGVDLVAADFDADGKLDLLVSSNQGSVYMMLGNGNGTFQPDQPFGMGELSGSLTVGDLNDDGKLDLVVGNSVLLGNGDGTLQTYRPYLAQFPGGEPVTGDFNKDGGLDLVVIANETVSEFLNKPTVALFPTTLKFGSQGVGTASPEEPITLSNSGSMPLKVTGITTTGDFSVINSCDTSIPVGGGCAPGVTFMPTTIGPRTGSALVTDNSPSSPHLVVLTGKGDPVALSSSTLNFGSQLVGTTSAPKTVTLTNKGVEPLTIISVAISDGFAQSSTCGGTLAVSAQCTFSVSFTPTSTGVITGALTINDNAPDTPHTVTLSGTGTDFAIKPASGSSTTATVTAGQSATYNLTFAPTGFAGTLSLVCTGVPLAATCTVPASLTLDGTNPATVTVSVRTTARSVATPGSKPIWPRFGLWTQHFTHLRWLWVLALMLAAALVAGPKRRPRVALAASLLFIVTWAACGGGGGGVHTPTGTPAGTYTLTVTGTSGSLSHSTTLTLNVN